MTTAFSLETKALASVPESWERRPLWTLIKRRDITDRPDAELLSVYRDHGVVPKASREDNFNKPSDNLSPYKYVRRGDLVLNKMKTWQGSIAVSEYEGIVSPAYYVCEVSDQVNHKFLHYLLRSRPYIGFYQALSKGIRPSQWDLPFEEFRSLSVGLPGREEQRRIAGFLDAEVARIDGVRARLSRGISLISERQESILGKVFEGESSRFSGEGGRIFQMRRLVARWIDYRGATPEKVDSGVPLVTAKNIDQGEISYALAREYISLDDYVKWMRRGLPEVGDILLTTEAPLGEVAKVQDSKIALAQRIILIRVDVETINNDWLYWYLRSPQGIRELQLRATGSTALGIKADRLRGVPVPIFSKEVMSERLAWLTKAVSHHETLQNAMKRQIQLLEERKRALITAAVTGQIDVTTTRGADVS